MHGIRRSVLGRYGAAIAIVAAVVFVRWLMSNIVGDQSPYVVFLPGIMLSAWYGGFGPGLLATLLAAIAADWFFISPGALFDRGFAETLRTNIFVADGLLISWMAARMNAAVQRSRRNEAELQKADRHKDEFLAILAHELRSPLAPLSHAVELLKRPEIGDSSRRDTVGMMDRQVRLMSRLVDDLLDVARIRQGKVPLRIETVALSGTVSQAIELCQPLFDSRQQQFSTKLPDEPLWVEGDPIRLTQVLSNLLTNASKYTQKEGRIALQVSRDAGSVCIRVSDNGIGIAADRLPHVFELFHQGDNSTEQTRSGLGLGLAVVRTLVRLHGGEIKASSKGPGKGSEFAVRLPLAEEPDSTARAPSGDDRVTEEDSRSLRLLIVEDNVDAATALAHLLRFDGHEVEIAADGPQALRKVAAWRPDVVLLDIGLPGMDGCEIARRLRADDAARGPLLIATTGHNHADDVRRAHESGFDHYLVKPVQLGELQELLQSSAAQGKSAIRA